MADVPEQQNDEGLREPRLALGWLTIVVICVGWMVFSRPAPDPGPPPWETNAIPKAEVVDSGPPVQPVIEAPRPAPETTAQAAKEAEAAAEQAAQPAPPVAVPEGVGFGPALGSRVTPEAESR